MSTVTTICLTIIVVALLVLAALFFFPKSSEGTVNVRVDDKAGVRIVHATDGIRLDIIYETYEERQDDPGLFPDIVNDVAPKGEADRDFWLDVVSLNDLSVERREEVVRKLHEYGWIEKERMAEFVLPPDDIDPDTVEDEGPDPVEVDPADTEAFDRAYPKDEDPDDPFETFNI